MKYFIKILLLTTFMCFSTVSVASIVDFPVGTTISIQNDLFGFTKNVMKDNYFIGIRYSLFSINLYNIDGNHPSGGDLRVTPGEDIKFSPLVIRRVNNQVFSFEQLVVNESNTTTGLSIEITGIPEVGGGRSFSHALAFDLNTATYDTFNQLALDSRFGSVRAIQLSASANSPLIDINSGYIMVYLQ